jgi:hypothetical protein
MTTILVVTLAVIAMTLFYIAVRLRRSHAAETVKPLDLQAFRMLMDRDDEQFLRSRLSHRKFFQLKRSRISVTWKYVARISGNAAAVMHMAEAARQNTDSAVAEVANQVVNTATQIRMQCLIAFAKLSAEFLFPALQLTPALLDNRYQALRESVARLGSLAPQNAAPLAAAI